MRNVRRQPKFARESVMQGLALASLLVMAGWALFGPSGLLAWSENQRMLAERQSELLHVRAERDELKNRVTLLDPHHTDPDLTGELLRSNLNVVHPDEIVMLLKDQP